MSEYKGYVCCFITLDSLKRSFLWAVHGDGVEKWFPR